LKELGFDMPCLKEFHSKNLITPSTGDESTNTELIELYGDNSVIGAPLKQQVFKWFREEHGFWITFEYDDCDCVEADICWYVGKSFRYGIGPLFLTNELGDFRTYEEAESACIDKLIEIVKNK
jgi:hypothetical protein